MIASTLDDRAAFDASLSTRPRLRADDAAGQAALSRCLALGTPRAECLAEVEAALDSRGLFCDGTLTITSAGKVCGQFDELSAAKAAALLKEAEARRGALPSRAPLFVAGGVALALAWYFFR